MKAVLLSIQPQWCEKIASGEKTVEVRKTAPKLKTPFKCYMYQTKKRWVYKLLPWLKDRQAKVIGEFICDKVGKYTFSNYAAEYRITDVELMATCLNHPELIAYGKGKPLYGWHISDLKIYDKPKELSEFIKPCPIKNQDCAGCEFYSDYSGKCLNRITRPPQSWCYVEELK